MLQIFTVDSVFLKIVIRYIVYRAQYLWTNNDIYLRLQKVQRN